MDILDLMDISDDFPLVPVDFNEIKGEYKVGRKTFTNREDAAKEIKRLGEEADFA